MAPYCLHTVRVNRYVTTDVNKPALRSLCAMKNIKSMMCCLLVFMMERLPKLGVCVLIDAILCSGVFQELHWNCVHIWVTKRGREGGRKGRRNEVLMYR